MKLYDMTLEEIKQLLSSLGAPPYRAQQVFSWCAKGKKPAEMTNLPKELREKLSDIGTGGVEIVKHLVSKDTSEKFLFVCEDGNAIEGVLMNYEFGSTLCISTQAGCRMGCVFCASGQCGLARNLTPGELCGQLYAVGAIKKFSNVVLMGCGEPLDNYENVVKFLKIVTSSEGLNLSARSISISTCGLADKIITLASEGLPVTLCISLHAADDEKRKKIMPIARKYSIIEVIEAAKRYDKKTGRRVVFEYALIDGFNDTRDDAQLLAKVTSGMRRHINLIPVNKGAGGFAPPSEKKIRDFEAVLRKARVSVTVRRTLGADIEGACGQLRSVYLKDKGD